MELMVKRDPSTDGCTLGRLFVNGIFEAFTLEDILRSGPKVMHETAIAEGRCQVALIAYASTQRSQGGRTLGRTGPLRGPAQFESAYGHTVIGRHAMAATRHMHEFGTRPSQLARICDMRAP